MKPKNKLRDQNETFNSQGTKTKPKSKLRNQNETFNN